MSADGVHDWETELGKGVANLIIPGIFLGDREVAAGPCIGFSAVLNITERAPNTHEGRLAYLRIACDDRDDVDLLSHSEEICDFIDRHHQNPSSSGGNGGAVLVHCQSGMSRSAAAVICFLMLRRGMSLRDAYDTT